MTLTRRAFARGAAAVAAATILPIPAKAQPTLLVRRSINDLIREQSPLIESYRRAVDVMMQREVTDKTSWWFQANIHDVPETELPQHRSLVDYWQQCPHKNYFFLSWHRMYLHFFERIARKASGDPSFALPYWAYDDPLQASLPTAFVPTNEELGSPPKTDPAPYMSRSNPLARAKRMEYVDRRWLGLGDVATDVSATLALDNFATDDKLDAQQAFGGVRTAKARDEGATGGIEGTPHNLIHRTIGLDGDMGATETAARDPIFWLHHCNIDRLWVKWTDPARGRIPPLDDDVWMKTSFRFVDEDGKDQQMTGAEVLDTQFQLGYRYDSDPPRAQQLDFRSPPVALGPTVGAAKGLVRSRAAEPVVVAATGAVHLMARESRAALSVVASADRSSAGRVPTSRAPAVAPVIASMPQRLRVVLKDVVAPAGAPPYDVLLVSGNAANQSVRLGSLALFGGGGHGGHAHGGGGETVVFEATEAVARLARVPGFEMKNLSVSVRRRGFSDSSGAEFVPPDPDPPHIGAIELLQS